ncbi:MAG: isoprenylcysteine carboxylmethyltransferase family protein [Roseiflexaceae bacterium]
MQQHEGRGEWWVVAQFILLGLIAIAPATLFGLAQLPAWVNPLGFLLAALGGAAGVAGVIGLGRNLTPFPKPKPDTTLVQSGIYAMVRHPIYFGLILVACGWAGIRQSLPALILSIGLAIFFEQKAKREERWLEQQFPAYSEYRQRVKGRILPWIA